MCGCDKGLEEKKERILFAYYMRMCVKMSSTTMSNPPIKRVSIWP